MDIKIRIKVDAAGGEPTVTAQAGGADRETSSPASGSSASGSGATAAAGGTGAEPPPDLLARAQAIGAHNAGPAPAGSPGDGAPPPFTSDAPRVALDEASYAEGLGEGPTDVSAGAAPGATGEEDLVVVAEAGPDAPDEASAGGSTNAGQPARRARKAAAKSTRK